LDEALLPFLRQHTPAWEAARVGRVTTGNLATALGLWCSEAAIGQLNLPKAGFKSREMQRTELEGAAAHRDARVRSDSGGGDGGCSGSTGQQQRMGASAGSDTLEGGGGGNDAHASPFASCSDDDDDDDNDEEVRVTRDLRMRNECVQEVVAYNASLGPHPPEDYTDQAEGGWAVSTSEAVAAAASGAGKVAAALGREQENAALYALLQVGSVRVSAPPLRALQA